MSTDFSVVIPDAGTEVAVRLSPHINDLVSQSDACIVWDDESLASASDLGKYISEALKSAEAERTKITGPINQGLRLLNDRFRQFTDPLTASLNKVSSAIRKYNAEEKERLAAEAAAARKAIEIKEAETNLSKPEDFVEPPPAPLVKAPVMRARGSFSSTSVTENWVGELEDIEKVPPEFVTKVLNQKAVNEAVKKGVREIAGVKIYDKGRVNFR